MTIILFIVISFTSYVFGEWVGVRKVLRDYHQKVARVDAEYYLVPKQ